MKARVGILLGIAVALVGALTLSAWPSPETPVSWMPSSVAETVVAGETAEIPVSFTTSRDLTDVAVRVVPELSGLVSVTPESLGNVPAGSTVQLTVTIAPAATSEPQAVDGTIQLHQSNPARRRYARPLPLMVKVVLPQTSRYTDSGERFSFEYPSNLHVQTSEDSVSLATADRLALLEHPDEVDALPEITVAVLPTLGIPIQEFVARYDDGWFLNYASREDLTVDGHEAVRFSDRGAAVGHAPFEAAFIEGNGFVLLVTLNDYETPKDGHLIGIFDQLLTSMEI